MTQRTAAAGGAAKGAPVLTLRQLNRTTLQRQMLLERHALDAATAIHGLAGLQAQYANSPYIALWSRLSDFAIEDLEGALKRRIVVKATALRNTLHLVAAQDYPAFTVAGGEARVANWLASARRAKVDIAELHERLLRFAHEPRTIAEMEADLEQLASDASLKPHVPTGVRHVAFQMASTGGWLVHVPPSGMWNTFAKAKYIDASAWLPNVRRPEPDAAIRDTVERYLGAYGPASIADIGKWIGLPRLPRIRAAVDGLGDRIRWFRGPDDRELVDLDGAPLAGGDERAPARFLAKWDSVLIGYDRRDRILPSTLLPAVVKRNGDFLPSILIDGFVAGTWATAAGKGELILKIAPIGRVAKAARAELTEEAEGLARFIGRDSNRHEVRWMQP